MSLVDEEKCCRRANNFIIRNHFHKQTTRQPSYLFLPANANSANIFLCHRFIDSSPHRFQSLFHNFPSSFNPFSQRWCSRRPTSASPSTTSQLLPVLHYRTGWLAKTTRACATTKPTETASTSSKTLSFPRPRPEYK